PHTKILQRPPAAHHNNLKTSSRNVPIAPVCNIPAAPNLNRDTPSNRAFGCQAPSKSGSKSRPPHSVH
ncbi:unnamed protein product, partial [Prunus brigantina]